MKTIKKIIFFSMICLFLISLTYFTCYILPSPKMGESNQIDIYDKKGNLILKQNIDIDYQNILIQKNNIVAYNNTECVMYNMSGREKYRGTFGKSVSLLIPANKSNRFIMITSTSADIIELN